MDIRNWGLNKIMQLPDSCFGRRYIISCAITTTIPGTFYDISELAFPETAVIWGLHVYGGDVASNDASIRLAIGDQLPPTAAVFNSLEPLFNGLGIQGAGPRVIRVGSGVSLQCPELRMPLRTVGRRLCLEFVSAPSDLLDIGVILIVSSIPTEVPDCLISV